MKYSEAIANTLEFKRDGYLQISIHYLQEEKNPSYMLVKASDIFGDFLMIDRLTIDRTPKPRDLMLHCSYKIGIPAEDVCKWPFFFCITTEQQSIYLSFYYLSIRVDIFIIFPRCAIAKLKSSLSS